MSLIMHNNMISKRDVKSVVVKVISSKDLFEMNPLDGTAIPISKVDEQSGSTTTTHYGVISTVLLKIDILICKQ